MTALYDTLGRGYADIRRPDPRIAEAVRVALGGATSVVNVGAGTGSYEPRDRAVIAVEPSPVMLAQRPAGAAPAVRGLAEALPLASRSVDAAMAVLTVHHWSDWRRGLAEMRRVSRGRVVVLVHDFSAPALEDFWLLRDYFTRLVDEVVVHPPLSDLREALDAEVRVVPVPADCTDGFLGAYWQRPASYLEPAVRGAISYFHRLDAATLADGLARLAADLESGAWRRRNAALLEANSLDLGYRLLVTP